MTGTGVEGVTVARGGTTVLRDVTLLAADGEILVVLGASGSGKSTLLRVLAGLERVQSGNVLIRGRGVTGLPSGERHVSMVFQSATLLPFLDVAHNLGWGLRLQHRPEAEVQERVSGRARQLRLGRLMARRPSELSGGERGLVGIGRALVKVPDVFLLDEPLGDLDAVQRVEVRRQIVGVVRSLGVPTFYVTHDPAEGLVVGDRVAVLHEGRIVQMGTPRELYERPVNLFVAEFIGAPPIGLLPARLVSAGGQAGFRVGARTLPLWQPVPPPLRDHVGRAVVLGLRAEDVHDAAASRDPDAVTLDAVVSSVEYTGRHNVVAMVLVAPPDDPHGGGPSPDGSSGGVLHSFFPPRAVIRPGDPVRISVEAAGAHVFDPATQEALWHPQPPADGEPAFGQARGGGDGGHAGEDRPPGGASGALG